VWRERARTARRAAQGRDSGREASVEAPGTRAPRCPRRRLRTMMRSADLMAPSRRVIALQLRARALVRASSDGTVDANQSRHREVRALNAKLLFFGATQGAVGSGGARAFPADPGRPLE